MATAVECWGPELRRASKGSWSEHCQSPNSKESSPRNRKPRLAPQRPLGELQPIRSDESWIEVADDETDDGWLTRKQRQLGRIIKSSRFQFGIGVLIALNTLVMGLELDQHDSAAPSETMLTFASIRGLPQSFFDGFEVFFFIMFSIEFAARVFVFRCRLLKEVATYVDLLALSPVVLLFGFNLQSSRQLTLLRIARLVKLCRLLRIFRLCKELHMLVQSIASALRALVWIGLLLLITVYCSAVACTMVIGHNSAFSEDDARVQAYQAEYGTRVDTQRHWGSMMRSMLTLFQIFTLDGWSAVVRPVIETHQPWMLVFFLAFIFITTFGLLNLLMGTIVDKAMQIARQHEEEMDKVVQNEQKQMLLACVRLFSLMDKDRDGVVTAPEIVSFLEQNDLQTVLDKEMAQFKIKLDYDNLMDILLRITSEWFDSTTPDTDGITVEEFSGAAARLQGVAKSQDMLTVLITAKTSLEKVQACEASLAQLREEARKQDAKLDSIIKILNPSPWSPGFKAPSTASSSTGIMNSTPQTFPKPTECTHHFSRQTSRSLSTGSDPSSPLRLTTPSMQHASEGSVEESSDGHLSVVHSLRGERNLFRRQGTSSIATLLKDMDGFDEFSHTKTASAMKGYSIRKFRGRSSERNSDAPVDTDNECLGCQTDASGQQSCVEDPEELDQIETPNAHKFRRSHTDGALAYRRAHRTRSNSSGFARLRGMRLSSVLTHGSTGTSAACSSIVPCAVPDQ